MYYELLGFCWKNEIASSRRGGIRKDGVFGRFNALNLLYELIRHCLVYALTTPPKGWAWLVCFPYASMSRSDFGNDQTTMSEPPLL